MMLNATPQQILPVQKAFVSLGCIRLMCHPLKVFHCSEARNCAQRLRSEVCDVTVVSSCLSVNVADAPAAPARPLWWRKMGSPAQITLTFRVFHPQSAFILLMR